MPGLEIRADVPDGGRMRRAAVVAALAGGLVIAQMVAAKATRDALFLTSHTSRQLATMMLASAFVSVLAVAGMTRALSRLGPARAVPFTFGLSAVVFVAEWVVLPRAPALAAVLVYLHIASLGGITVSGYWSVVTERFDPRSAKRLIGRINAGTALGGVLGGLLAVRGASMLGLRGMVLALAVCNGIAALFVSAIAGPERNDRVAAAGPLEGVRLLRQMPYLRSLAALVALTGAAAALCDYAFKSMVAGRYERGESMAGFFALFYGLSSLATFVVQAGFARRALQRLGLAGTIVALPLGVALGSLLGALVTRLVTVVALRAVEVALSHSLFRSAYELFYTPLRPEKKRPTKTIIDVAFDRLGDATGSGIVLALLALAPERPVALVLGAAAAVSVLAVWVSRRLHGGYVQALSEAVKASAVSLAPEDALDATTKLTISQLSVLGLTRPMSVPAAAPPDPVLARAADLASGELARTLRALTPPLSPRLVAFALPLLARPELQRPAFHAIRSALPRAAGEVADALLDPTTPKAVRVRLPALLSAAGDQRAADALVDGLDDPDFAVRSRCERVLRRMVAHDPALLLSPGRLTRAAERELDRIAAGGDDRDERERSLAHLFAVMALAFGEPPLRLAWTVLDFGDERLRGTALEYVENVVPDVLRRRLWPFVDDRRPKKPPRRDKQLIVDELRASLPLASTRRAAAAP